MLSLCHQGGYLDGQVAAGQCEGDGIVVERPPDAVGADRDDVAILQQGAAREFDLRCVITPEAGVDAVAAGMAGGALGVEQPLVHHQLHAGVISRLHVNATIAQQVQARVAGVRPVGVTVLDQAGDDGGAWRFGQILVQRVVEDGVVRARQRT
ncbi:hypothetical protein SDC9_145241 [bioreactor metagenome]|uniref:Uncharacterized protein n=1 Tax=bioreactor metagenome TaxID=1076179 RepID=A0A645E8F7_9ZZZZ